MATRIRLQRHGKKNNAFYHIVAADSRAKRDGKFIEKLGTYNPNTNPATIDINFERTLHWVQVGAELSDTAKSILHYKGVMYKNHLLKGVAKGALTDAQVEEKFSQWMADKDAKITGKTDGLTKAVAADKAARLKAEVEVNAARAKEIEAKNTPVEEAPVAETPAAEVASEEVEAPVAEVEAEAPAAEEAPAADSTEEEKTAE